MPGAHLRQRALERARRDPFAASISAISPASFRSRSVSTRSTVGRHCQRRAGLERAAESRDAGYAPISNPTTSTFDELRQLLPQSGPQALRLDGDAREVADFVPTCVW